MTREEAIKVIRKMLACTDLSVRANLTADMVDACRLAIKALEQEPCEDCISREAVLNLFNKSDDYTWETALIKKKIEKIPPITPQKPFINKPCVSSGVCEHDKNKMLDNIRAEIENIELLAEYTRGDIKRMALDILDKYKDRK